MPPTLLTNRNILTIAFFYLLDYYFLISKLKREPAHFPAIQLLLLQSVKVVQLPPTKFAFDLNDN